MLSSFYPVVAGRTSDANSRYRSLYQVQSGRIAIQDLEQQLSTGLRFSLPSQDPSAAIRVIGLQRELEFRDQTLRNLDSSQGYLNATESNLANAQDIVTELRGLGQSDRCVHRSASLGCKYPVSGSISFYWRRCRYADGGELSWRCAIHGE